MKNTFVCNETMIITIPIGNLKDPQAGQLMPEKFHCVFRDSYKVFAVNGKPQPLGAAQAIAGVFLCILGQALDGNLRSYTLLSVLFVISGLLSYSAGKAPNMHVAKLSFSLNIISFFGSIAVFSLCIYQLPMPPASQVSKGITGVVMSLLVGENLVALFLIYWLNKAVCKEDFNLLPIILLKRGD